jgi:hypothetical protein
MNEITNQSNPFQSSPVATRPTAGNNAVANTDSNRAIAEVQAAMMIARMNPRDPVEAMDRILNACCRSSLAEVAVYQYARGGSDISGPSIRLAEAIAQSWGNLQFGIRELSQGNGESTVQAFAWDVETNTRREVTFQIPHKRHTKKGSYQLEDPRDIYELVANQGARRLRACILAVIPGDVTEAAVNQCELTMKSKADTSPDAIKKMVEAFSAFGVTSGQIEQRIQRRLEAISPAQIISMKKIYSSLRDGMSVPADWFEVAEEGQKQPSVPEEKKKGTEGLKSKLRETVNTSTGEITPKHEDQPPMPEAPPPEDSTAEPESQRPDASAEKVKAFKREINVASTNGSIAVDQWRMKHHNRVANAFGGLDTAGFKEVMQYAEMIYQEMVKSEQQG